jgi:hypothetical protein
MGHMERGVDNRYIFLFCGVLRSITKEVETLKE